ncbi:MAG: ATP phosphoribosyltransferase [Ignavibacteria bacterium]|nr:MAG: ATP phosphoribosyltransferase [Ignavibacteria bacterium]KAF0159905.1 MAG: ATP phosphoribosyltransferase [Ignavibacteria bacterium]
MLNGNLRLAVQKKGRLTEKSLQLLRSSGLGIEEYSERLVISARNYELDLLFLRDDDIPEYVQDGVADIGIVGEDIIFEKRADVKIIRKLGYGKCKLALALPETKQLNNLEELDGQRIATSFPHILQDFLDKNKIKAKIVEISGSVEIAPTLGVADYICDLVSTGNTLKLNKLKKSFDVFESQAALIVNKDLEQNQAKYDILQNFLFRIDSALRAKSSKYLMMNAPKESLDSIKSILPSLKSPTVVPLADPNMIAVHAVIPAEEFWNIFNQLKEAGATGVLLLPIENMIL